MPSNGASTNVLRNDNIRMAATTDSGIHLRSESPSNCQPRHWGRARKSYDTCLVILLEFYTTTISTAGTPVAEKAHQEIGISSFAATVIFVSVYLVGQGIGGVFFPPWSESFGRKQLYVISTALYSLFCILLASIPSITGIVVGRFFTGLLSSIPTIIVTGSIEDLWDTQARVWWISCWAMAANLGLLAGPMISDAIMTKAHWKWVFYTAASVTACVAALLLTIRESRPSVIFSRTHNANSITTRNLTPREALDLLRPLRLLITEPIILLISIISAAAFGIIYLFTGILPTVYLSFEFSDSQKNLPFLAVGLGVTFSLFTRRYDSRILARRSAQSLPITPETKLAGFVIGAPLLAVCLWWFAWTTPPRVTAHWAVATVALVPIGYSLNEFATVLAGYLTDCYRKYAASGFGAVAITRSLFSATFPLIGRLLFQSLDFNVAMTTLAVMATIFCAAPPVLIIYGHRLREMSVLARSQHATHH